MSFNTDRLKAAKILASLSIATSASLASLSGQSATLPAALEPVHLKPFVVTAPKSENALEVVLDAKVAYQPMPAQDGADYLKNVPGFSVIRKGGTDGDPTLRGMAGSRLGISLDGQAALGGCSHRMDPPTAYVFPAAYDRVTILKGPQSVIYGPGLSAGIVRFESDLRRMDRADSELRSNLTVGSFGRVDVAVDGTVGNPHYYGRLVMTRTDSGDYEDGSGRAVHARHLRWSGNASIGWTPDDDTALQYTAVKSNGDAAYADRMMDGAFFDRKAHQLRLEREMNEGPVRSAELELGYNVIDHAMDNYSVREFAPTMMMPHRTVSNPERRTAVGRARVEVSAPESARVTLGADFQNDVHRLRSAMNQDLMPYQEMDRKRDAEFSQYGVFGEMEWNFSEARSLFAGLRVDDWRAKDLREEVALGMMGRMPNPTEGARRRETLLSGFTRFESKLTEAQGSYYVGIGYVERFLDYWELVAHERPESLSGFYGAPERTAQLDLGFVKQLGAAELNVAAFFSDVDDFALVESGYRKPSGAMGSRSTSVVRGVSARTWGGEAALTWHFNDHWLLDASLAYTRGENRTDALPLAQIAPLESRLSLSYTRRDWSVGGLVRAVSPQNRVAIGQGNIVGRDIGASPGFAVFSLNGSWHLADGLRLSAGVDNLLDKEYAEHISRAGGAIAGYAQTTRVNEPGRTAWLRFDYTY